MTALLEFCAQDTCVPPLGLFALLVLSLVSCTLALTLQFLQQTSNRRPSVFLVGIFLSGSAVDSMFLRDSLLNLCFCLLQSVAS